MVNKYPQEATTKNTHLQTSPLEPLSDNEENSEEQGYNEPSCSWNPGETDDDCGEGIICPPCG